MHRSVLSLTSSHEVGYYDEIARNLDANLAEVEMEDFQSHDIHSILSTLHNDIQVSPCSDLVIFNTLSIPFTVGIQKFREALG